MTDRVKSLLFYGLSTLVYLLFYLQTNLSQGILFGGFLIWFSLAPKLFKIQPFFGSKYQYLIGFAFMIFIIIMIITKQMG